MLGHSKSSTTLQNYIVSDMGIFEELFLKYPVIIEDFPLRPTDYTLDKLQKYRRLHLREQESVKEEKKKKRMKVK